MSLEFWPLVYNVECCLTRIFVFLQLPMSMYKKVLVILHDSVLPHMSDPTLMIDFLTAAYNVGESFQQVTSYSVSLEISPLDMGNGHVSFRIVRKTSLILQLYLVVKYMN